MKPRVKCPKCEKEGRLEQVSEGTYRINHDFMKNKEKFQNRCYLGKPYQIIEKIRTVSKIRPDLVDDNLVEQVLKELKNKSTSDTLLLEILELNRKLGFGWYNKTHDLLKQDNCPHCKNKIAVRYRRIGRNPNQSGGRYDVTDFNIEKGQKGHTSKFKRHFSDTLKNEFERGVEKGNPNENYVFYEDV